MSTDIVKIDWHAKVSEFVDSGLSVGQYCKREKLNLKTFHYHRYSEQMKQKYPVKKMRGNAGPKQQIDWDSLTAKFVDSGLSYNAFCREEDLNYKRFKTARYKLKDKYPLKNPNIKGRQKTSYAHIDWDAEVARYIDSDLSIIAFCKRNQVQYKKFKEERYKLKDKYPLKDRKKTLDNTEIDWHQKVGEMVESGLSIGHYCKEQGFHLKKFGYHRYSDAMKKKYPLKKSKSQSKAVAKSAKAKTKAKQEKFIDVDVDWDHHMTRFERTGISEAEYCTMHGLNQRNFQYQLDLKQHFADNKQSKFIEAELVETPEQTDLTSMQPIEKPLKLYISSDNYIEIPSDISKTRLQDLLNVLRSV